MSSAIMPAQVRPGTVVDYSGGTIPPGWLLMYGQEISRVTYARLFEVIGTFFGAGDGSTTFRIGDARGRVTFGLDNMGGTTAGRLTVAGGGGSGGTSLGAAVGWGTIRVANEKMPNHSHQYYYPAAGWGGSGVVYVTNGYTGATAYTNYVGGDGFHNNVQPTFIVNRMIKT